MATARATAERRKARRLALVRECRFALDQATICLDLVAAELRDGRDAGEFTPQLLGAIDHLLAVAQELETT